VQAEFWENQHSVTRVIQAAEPTIKATVAKELGQQVTQAVFAKAGEFQGLANPDATLADLATKLPPSTLQAAMQHAQDLVQPFQGIKQQFSDRPWFVTAQRFGQYHITYEKDGVMARESAKTQGQLNVIKTRLSSDPTVKNVSVYDQTVGNDTAGLAPDAMRAYQAIEKVRYEKAMQTLPPDEQERFRQQYSFGEAVAKEMRTRGIGKFFEKRNLTPGVENMDLLQGTFDYLTTLPHAIARRYTNSEANIQLADPELMQNPSVRNLGRQQLDNVLAPGSNIARIANEGVFQYFLGGNVSSLLAVASHPLMRVPAQLVRDGATYGQSASLLGRASKTLIDAIGGKFSDPRIQTALLKAEADRVVDRGIADQFTDTTDHAVTNLSQFANGGPLTDIGKEAMQPLDQYMNLTKTIFSKATAVTSRLTFLAGLHKALDEGKGLDDAYNYAKDFTRLTAFVGGKAARSPTIMSGEYIPRSVVQMVASLQHFSWSSIAMFTRLGLDALGKTGLEGRELWQARKAFGLMAGTQFVLAGALGMPGMAAGVAMMEQLFPNLQLKKNMRETVAGLAGNDHVLGGQLADFAMKGLPTMMGPVDLSARLGLGNMLGVDPQSGFTAADLAGAPGSILKNMVTGVQNLSQGNYLTAAENMLPVVFKNGLKLYENGGDARSASGALLAKLTPSEQIASAVGLTPSRISNLYDEEALGKRSDAIAARELSQFHSQLATQLIAGDQQGVRKALLDRAKVDPSYSPAAGLRAVIEQVQERTMPQDPLRTGSVGNAQDRQNIYQSFQQTGPPPSEVQRTLMMQQDLTGMNLVGTRGMTPATLAKAQMVDELMQQNPYLPRAVAVRMVESHAGMVGTN
jgi:hypothetical protein